jgi:glutamate-1-semialdehyde 2,1-aminomutase
VPASFAQETVVLPYNDRAALDAAFAANPQQIACVIIEPYCGNVGFIMPDPGYLEFLRAACTREGSVLIFDEVMTGFRLHRAGVQGLLSESQVSNLKSQFAAPFTPDLTCLGKIIGGGLPVGAFGGRAEIMDLLAPLGPVYQAGTLSGNPLAMAAGIASLRLLDELDPYARLDAMGKKLAGAILAAAREKGLPTQVPQRGSMFSIFFADAPVRDYATALRSDAKLFARLFRSCLDAGVYLAPSAYEAAFLSTAHEGSAIDRACEVLASGIRGL